MAEQMVEETRKEARRSKLATLRQHLEHMPAGALFNSSMAAIYLGVSTKTLARWRKVKGMGPPFLEPVVAEGVDRTTQPHKYRKQELDIFVSSRMSVGGFDFASLVEPWRTNAAGAIEGSALGMALEVLLDSDTVVATLLYALAVPRASAGAMRPYRYYIVDTLSQALATNSPN